MSEEQYKLYIASTHDKDNNSGGGAVLLSDDGEKIEEFTVKNKDAASTSSFAGEVHVLLKALKWINDQKYNHISIFYDYDGISNWVSGKWSAKNNFTQEYASEIISYKNIDLNFVKVDKKDSNYIYAHSLAKRGLNLEKENKDGSYTIEGVNRSTVKKLIKIVKQDGKLSVERGQENDHLQTIRCANNTAIVTVTFYKNTYTCLVQGKDKDLIKQIINYLVTYLNNTDTVIDALATTNPSINKDVVEREFHKYLPHYKELSESEEINQIIKNMLNQTVFNLKDRTECYDYTYKLGSALRLSEYFLYKALVSCISYRELRDKGIIDVNKRFHFYKAFSVVNDVTTNEFNTGDYQSISINNKQVQLLNELYQYFEAERCVYFHIGANTDNIQWIRTPKDCETKLKRSLALFDKFYELI